MQFKFLYFLIIFQILKPSINFDFKTNTYGTHQPVLYEMAKNTQGPIIEFGSGDSSTDLLHEICKKEQRLLITLDDNLEWLNKYKQKYLNDGYKEDNSGWHQFYYVPGKYDDWNPDHWIKFFKDFVLLKNINFELCFIDQSPWLARFETLKLLKDTVKYIIMHDCDFFPAHNIFGKIIQDATINVPGIFDFSNEFKYFKVYYPVAPWAGHTGPPTLLGSNFESNLPEIDYSQY